MNNKIIILAVLVIFFGSCKSYKEYRVSNYAHMGIEDNSTYMMWLNKNFSGCISENARVYWRDDSVQWRYKNGLMYFKNMSTHDVKGDIPTNYILPDVCLYSKKGLYVPTNSSYIFLHKIPFRTQGFKLYVKEIQDTRKEGRIIKRCFGDKERIDRKLSKAKSLEEIFQEEEKIHFYWFYKFWDDVNTELYSLFKAPKHPH
jgi:hypothetical protein